MKMGDLHIPPVCPSSSVRGRRIYEGAMAVMKKSRDIRIAAMIKACRNSSAQRAGVAVCACAWLNPMEGRDR